MIALCKSERTLLALKKSKMCRLGKIRLGEFRYYYRFKKKSLLMK